MKKFILFGIIIASGMLYSCSNDEDQDLSTYVQKTETSFTGGENEQLPPPPPPPVDPD